MTEKINISDYVRFLTDKIKKAEAQLNYAEVARLCTTGSDTLLNAAEKCRKEIQQ